MTSGGDGVRKAEIFTIGELYRQFEARYNDPQETGKWSKNFKLPQVWAAPFDGYSHASKLSDGKWHTVQILKTRNGGVYYLKLYGDKSRPLSIPKNTAEMAISDDHSRLPQLCLLKEAIDNALKAVNLSAKVYTRDYSKNNADNLTEVTAARCAALRK